MTRFNQMLALSFSRFVSMGAMSAENEDGQTLVEYALIIALIAIVCVGAIGFLTGGIESEFTTIADSL